MRTWTVWCVAMYFFEARAKITQTSGLVLKEDEKAMLACSQNDNHDSMYWYLQLPGKGLQLIYYSFAVNREKEGDVHIGYKANRLSLAEFYLEILSVKMNHSAVYFCASSVDTTLQSHLLALHKLPAGRSPSAAAQHRCGASSRLAASCGAAAGARGAERVSELQADR
uniref:Immunoglobulin V-set domain-containing protein n=1 Tax=Falco tinnunculus TaxID=100819 RepID=A0A8C4TWB6_FALTI